MPTAFAAVKAETRQHFLAVQDGCCGTPRLFQALHGIGCEFTLRNKVEGLDAVFLAVQVARCIAVCDMCRMQITYSAGLPA